MHGVGHPCAEVLIFPDVSQRGVRVAGGLREQARLRFVETAAEPREKNAVLKISKRQTANVPRPVGAENLAPFGGFDGEQETLCGTERK